jgi:hypothetical protein
MTQDPPQSWPPREPGRSGTRPLAVDPITGELIETDAPPGGEFWVPAAPDAAVDPTQVGYAPPAAPAAWSAGQGYPEAGYAPGYPPAGYPPPAAYPPPAYGAPGPYGYPAAPAWGPPYPAARPTNGMAVASLVLGALWLFWIGSVLALVFGYLARGQMRRTGEGGDGLALAGLILGWIGVGTLVLSFVAGALGGGS